MNSQELRNLQEAYLKVVENQQLDEAYVDFTKDRKDSLGRPKLSPRGKALTKAVSSLQPNPGVRHPDDEKNKGRSEKIKTAINSFDSKKVQAKSAANKNKKKAFGNRLTRSDRQGIRDSYDYYDIILSHLLDEGYAETPEAAEVIMVNMSEEWRESIVEAIEGLRPASERMARGVLTSSQRASQKARARREEKKKEELEKAANAILNQIGGTSRRSSAPMGSTPAPQKAEAPEANRRIKPRMKSDDLASAADKVLRSLR